MQHKIIMNQNQNTYQKCKNFHRIYSAEFFFYKKEVKTFAEKREKNEQSVSSNKIIYPIKIIDS